MVAVTSAFVEIVPDFSGFSRRANSEMSNILGAAGDNAGAVAGKNAGSGIFGGIRSVFAGSFLNDLVQDFGRSIGNIVASGVRYGFQAIALSSDLAETQSAVGQVFGTASKDVSNFAKTAVKTLGQTEQQALNASKTFGIMGNAAGLTGGDLSGFSTDLVGLSTDLASFNNTSPQEAIDALGAGLRGEAEPLRKYGILLDDASLKAKALELGIYDGNGTLTAQQRILAANASIFDQSKVAQGDFERTSGGLANQQKILGASFEEAKTKLGTALLPAMTTFVTLLNDKLVPILGDVINQVGPKLGDALVKAAPAFGDLLLALIPLIPPLIDLAINALPPLIDFFIAISPLLIDFAKFLGDSQVVTQAFFDVLTGDITVQQFTDKVGGMGSKFGEVAGAIGQFITDTVANLSNFSASVGVNIAAAVGFIVALPGKAAAALLTVGATLYQSGRSMIQGFIDGIKAMAKPVTDAVGGIMRTVAGFFPNSPAKYGPFSGSGWTNLKTSGGALFDQFNSGFGSQQLSFAGVDVSQVTAGRIPDSSFGTSGNGSGERPIFMDGTLFGVMRELATGEAQIVVNASAATSRRVISSGKK